MWLGIIVLTATSGHALQGRPAVVQFHEALLAGLDARDALARLESMKNATPDVVTYSLVAASLLDAGLDEDADDVLERGAAFSKKRAAYRKPTKRGVVAAAAASLGQPLHEDEQVLAVSKPNGVLSMTEGTTKGVATLPDAVEHAYGVELSDLGGPLARGVVHRLDRDVSGCMVLAKTRRAHALLIREFAARRVEKTYLAVGVVQDGASLAGPTTVDEPIQGKPAETEVEPLAQTADFALFRCKARTGRKHQVRKHCAALGFPLVGEVSPPKKRVIESPSHKGVMLHAASLRVPGVVDVSCPPPDWWRGVPLGLALDDVL
jgi:23S rRNA-/tRNA-specific pseudouridylate synthase